MIKQSQVRSFINLLNKIGQQKKSEKTVSMFNGQQYCTTQPLSDHETQLAQSHNFDDKQKTTLVLPVSKKNSTKKNKNKMNIFLQKFKASPAQSDKRNLYDIYRESLQKKKQYLSSLIVKNDQMCELKQRLFSKKYQRDKKGSRELCFPISRSKNHRTSKDLGQNIIIKKNHHFTPFEEFSAKNISEKKTKNQNTVKHNFFDKLSDEEQAFDQANQKMRKQKLVYKPILRVRKLRMQTNEDQHPQVQKNVQQIVNKPHNDYKNEQQCLRHRRCFKVKTELKESDSKTQLKDIFINRNQKYFKQKEKINKLMRLDRWEDDDNNMEDPQFFL